jgi:hypothetical protein
VSRSDEQLKKDRERMDTMLLSAGSEYANEAVIVAGWYAALARRMDRAVDAAEERRTQLREVRAALRGAL